MRRLPIGKIYYFYLRQNNNVDTADFTKFLHHFSGSSVKEAEMVLQLKDAYPFSQLLHVLSARVSQDHGFSNNKSELQLAAVYSADRTVLKDIMELEYNAQADSILILEKKQIGKPDTSAKLDFTAELMADLERLHHLKQNFEMMFVDGATVSLATPQSDDVVMSDNITKSKKERIIELAKAINPSPDTNFIERPVSSRRQKKREVTDTLINDIVSKDELIPESEKHKEQIEIIDQFIRIQPSISGLKEKESYPSDLTTIKTGEFGENIISETLVEILVKQGKKDKAIEVLKKLIWKFPQKKAYFAAQIEELRK